MCVSQEARPGSILCCRWDDKNVRQTFVVRSPRKSTKRASLESNIPKTTVWKIMKKRLRCKPNNLQLVQALSDGDEKRLEFCGNILTKWKTKMINWIKVFRDETTFHESGKVNRHNVRTWDTENPLEIVEHVRYSPNVFVLLSSVKVYDLSSSPNQL